MVAGSRKRVGGKSGHRRTGWWITSTGRKIRESATESKPPFASCRGYTADEASPWSAVILIDAREG